MRTLQILTAAAGILIAVSGPSLAAQRVYRGADAYASGVNVDRSGAYNYGPVNSHAGGYTPAQKNNQFIPGQNLPYPDRPYGAPDHW